MSSDQQYQGPISVSDDEKKFLEIKQTTVMNSNYRSSFLGTVLMNLVYHSWAMINRIKGPFPWVMTKKVFRDKTVEQSWTVTTGQCVGNSIDESHLPFMSGNQWYQGPLSISDDEKKIFKTFPPGKEDDRVEGEDEETWHRRNRTSPRTRRRRNLRGWSQRVGRPVDSSF